MNTSVYTAHEVLLHIDLRIFMCYAKAWSTGLIIYRLKAKQHNLVMLRIVDPHGDVYFIINSPILNDISYVFY